MFTITPRQPSASGSLPFAAEADRRSTLNVPTRLISSTLNASSWRNAVTADRNASAHPIPAQRMQVRSDASSVAAPTAARISSSLVTSAGEQPADVLGDGLAFGRAAVDDDDLGALARRGRMAVSPMPDPPPVTTAELPASCDMAEDVTAVADRPSCR